MTSHTVRYVLVAALLAMTSLVACGDDSSESNNGAANNGGLNNGTDNNGTDNNGAPNNGTANNGVDNNGTANNGTANNGTANNGTDDVAVCQDLCGTVTACQEFIDACGQAVADQARTTCEGACADDADARAQILAVGNLPCATVVPLAIDGFGLGEVCTAGDTLCDTYCNLTATSCTGGDALYADAAACQAACAGFDDGGTDGDTSGDTVQCRIYHATAAANDAATHCPHAAADGGGVCVSADLCANVQCTGTDLCNPATGACEAFVCEADAREPNEDAASATQLTATDQVIDGTICTGDEDWFAISLAAGQSLRAVSRFVDAVGDLELRLRDEDGTTTLDSSAGTDDTEAVYVANVATGKTVYVLVEGFSNATNRYRLTIEIDPAGTLCDANADCLAGEICVDALCEEAPPCTTDDDCTGTQVCEVGTGLCRECLTDADCRGEVCSEFVCVECVEDADCGEGFSCSDSACTLTACDGGGDANEPNEDEASATALAGAGELAGLSICDGDEDWFSFTVAEGDTAYVLVAFRDDLGDIDAELLDATGETVDDSTSTSDNEALVGESLAAGTYYIHVYGYNGAVNAYTLSLELNPTATLCSFDSECTVQNQECRDRQCQDRPPCAGDTDCAFDEVCQTETGLCVGCLTDDDCTSDEFCVDLDCAECRNDADCSEGYTCGGGTCNFVACELDPYEPNDTTDTAIGVSDSTTLDGGAICGDDVDFYSLDLMEGDSVYVLIEFIDANGDLEAELRDIDGDVVSGGHSSTDNEVLFGRNLPAGKYFIVVDGYLTVENVYAITLIINPDFTLCTATAECGFNELCIDRRCETRPPCAADADCMTDEVCEVGTGICRECLADADCGTGEVCDTANFACVQCLDDSQCTNGLVCAGGACVDAACLADPFEGASGNNTRETATDTTGLTRIEGAILCEDDDWYVIPVAEGESLHVFVEFIDADGDIDVALTNSATMTIDTGASVSDNETVFGRNLPAGNYYLRVYDIGEFVSTYAITITVGPDVQVCDTNSDCDANSDCTNNLCVTRPPCTTDADCRGGDVCDIATGLCYECLADADCGTGQVCGPDNTCVECVTDLDCTGDFLCIDSACAPILCAAPEAVPNNTRATATSIAPGAFDDAICTDEDWFSFQVAQGEDVWVGVTFTDAYGDIDAALSNSNSTSIDTGTSGSDNEYLVGRDLAAGTYYVRVYGYGGQSNAYGFELAIGNLPVCNSTADCAQGEYCTSTSLCDVCDGDRFEPNDSAAAAVNIDDDLTPAETLNTCGGPDFYTFSVEAGQQITVDVLFQHSLGDIDIELLNPDLTRATSAVSSSNDEHLTHTAAQTGLYVLRVYGYSGAVNDYTMSVQLQ